MERSSVISIVILLSLAAVILSVILHVKKGTFDGLKKALTGVSCIALIILFFLMYYISYKSEFPIDQFMYYIRLYD